MIKADYFLDPENKKQQCINLINEVGLTNVKLIWGELTTVQLFELYNFADVYVTATRAEGWGLPIIEAAATGLPIIAPFYSGHTEFLKDIHSSLVSVDIQLSLIDDEEFKMFWPSLDSNYGSWAEVQINSLKNSFITAYKEPTLLSIGRTNSFLIRTEFNWGMSVFKGLRSLSEKTYLKLD